MSGARPPAPWAPQAVPPRSKLGKYDILKDARAIAQAHGEEHNDVGPTSSDWRDFFDEKRFIACGDRGEGAFNVYLAGSSGTVLFCLHGGGYTGLSFALFAKELKDTHRVVAMDMRHHGESTIGEASSEGNEGDVACERGAAGDGPTPPPSQTPDLSKDTLVADAGAVWAALFGSEAEEAPTVLVGHSVGGAVAIWAAAAAVIPALEGLAVIDVVEGTALAALPKMVAILATRPESFAAPEEATQWAVEHNHTRSRRAAAVSMPSQLVCGSDGRWRWRTLLARSEPFWEGWYRGLSAAFLATAVPKVLLLAGTDRLDQELTIAQMQGKFQMALVAGSGHAVHEDKAADAAEIVRAFVKRFRIGLAPLPLPRPTPPAPIPATSADGSR